MTVSSRGSEDRDAVGVDFRGDSVLLFRRVVRSARPDELEEAEESWELVAAWLARAAREERRAASIAANDDVVTNVCYM